ncbi:MAG: hypothetical protein ABS46_10370 [Cytophagaceae bacterium SCN 52-12]|nr:MAG: hypothetical protein ABS46_10370 [Cytophagaceae bacterium SCN 52-12]
MPRRSLFIIVLVAVLIPVAVYLRVWDYYAVNIAKWDDHALKRTLLDYIAADGISGVFSVLSAQHNEHRIFLTRLIAILDYSWYGQLDYRHLMFAGNLLLLGIIVLWWRLLKHNGKTLFALLPVALIWPTLAHWENMYWGMASIQNFGVVTLGALAVYWCLKRPWGYFAAGILAAALSAFSSGNGLLVLPIITLVLFLSRENKKGIIAAASVILVLVLYFASYHQPDYNAKTPAGVWALTKGFMAFIGSFAEVFPVKGRQDTSVVFGVILFLVSISIVSTTLFRLVRNQYSEPYAKITDAFCLGIMLFILGTAAVVVWGRAGSGIEVLLTSRYKIYSFLLLITAYLFIVIPIRGSFYHPYVSGVAVLCLLFNVFSYHYYLVDAYNLRKFMVTSYFNSVYDNKALNPFTADTSISRGLVARPSLFYEHWLPLIPNLSDSTASGNLPYVRELARDTQVSAGKSSISVVNDNYQSQRLQDSGAYLLLSNSDRYFLLPTFRERNRNRKQLFFRQQYFAPGFSSEHTFGELGLRPGSYRYALVLQKGDSTGIMMYKDSLTISEFTRTEGIKTNW